MCCMLMHEHIFLLLSLKQNFLSSLFYMFRHLTLKINTSSNRFASDQYKFCAIYVFLLQNSRCQTFTVVTKCSWMEMLVNIIKHGFRHQSLKVLLWNSVCFFPEITQLRRECHHCMLALIKWYLSSWLIILCSADSWI